MVLSLAESMPNGASIVVDSNPLLYLFEGSPLLAPFEPLLAAIDAGRIEAVTTPVTLAEVVTGPLRSGQEPLARQYQHLLTRTPGWRLREIDAEIAVLAVRLRIRHRLKLPDAIQLAAAIQEDCHALLTHDRNFGDVSEILILGTTSSGKAPRAKGTRSPDHRPLTRAQTCLRRTDVQRAEPARSGSRPRARTHSGVTSRLSDDYSWRGEPTSRADAGGRLDRGGSALVGASPRLSACCAAAC